MRKFYLAILTLTLLLALPMASMAEETDETAMEEEATVSPAREKNRMEIMEEKKTMKEEAIQTRKEAQEEIMQKREEAKEQFAQDREEFQMKLKEITDERKQEIVEKVDVHIAEMNEKITTRLAEHLDKISEIIDRIEAKAAEQEEDSKTVDDAITVARSAVETAQTAVAEQAGKEYIIELTDDSNLKDDVKAVVTQFRTDIKATVETVREAREKTVDAARALGDGNGPVMMQKREATKSGMTDELGG